jgi:hypothetical protein
MPPADIAAAWRRAYARQAASDFQVYDLLCVSPGVDECQRMHYLQMALEKSAKAHFWSTSGVGTPDSKVNRSHKVAEKFLPLVMLQHWATVRPGKPMPGNLKRAVKLLCQEVDLLAPAVLDGESRRDNCEYPWEEKDSSGAVVAVLSPLDHAFGPSNMMKKAGMATFMKAVRSLVLDIVG